MKSILSFLISTISLFTFGQTVDTNEVVFNAKLFTLSKHKVLTKEKIVEEIEKIESEVYNIDEFYFIKIKNRIYSFPEAETRYSEVWSDCYYYVCYSSKKQIFYLLLGFENDTIKQFAKEFLKSNALIDEWNKSLNPEIVDFLNNVVDGKYKKAKKSLRTCNETYPEKKI